MYKINILETGYIMADGGAMFGAIPKRAWKRKYASNEDNLCPLAMRCVLAVSDTRKILIDTGMGDKHTTMMSYYQPHSLVHITDAITTLGYSLTEITDVVLTHLHFDHCGGATTSGENNKIIPAFPHARYWLSQKQWENFLNPNLLEKDSILVDNIRPVFDAGILHLIDEDTQIDTNCSLHLFDGHSNGQIVVRLNTADGIYAFPGDLIPTSSHISLEWISAYDICALTSLNEKERFLTEAEKEDYHIIYCHDNVTPVSKVKKLNNDFKATPI